MAAFKPVKVLTTAIFLRESRRLSSRKIFYAVGRGREPGIYNTWNECKVQILRYPSPKFKKFLSCNEAEEFVNYWKNQASSDQGRSVAAESKSIAETNNNDKVVKKLTKRVKEKQPSQEENSLAATLISTSEPQSPSLDSSKAKSDEEHVGKSAKTLKKSINCLKIIELNIKKIKDALSLESNSQKEVKSKWKEKKVTIAEAAAAAITTPIVTTDIFTRSKTVKEEADESKEEETPTKLSSDKSKTAKTLPQLLKTVSDPPEETKKEEKSEDSFITDENNYVNVYTDGSASPNWGTGSKAGLGVWFGEDHPLNVSKAVEGVTTNNTAEILAAITAIQVAKKAGIKKLKILTDSEFVINAATRWVYFWMRRGWFLQNGGRVKHKKELQQLLKEAVGIELRWEKVDAHKGIVGNESAHGLAASGAEKNNKAYP